MLDHLLSVLAPHECLICQSEGNLLCSACRSGLSAIPERCYKCRALSPDARTCSTCRSNSPLHTVQAATVYADAAKDLVWRLKFAHAQAAIEPMAALIASRLVFEDMTLLSPVPTASRRIRQRGYDQAELLCRAVAHRSGMPYASVLARHGQSRQVGASRAERLRHLEGAFWVRNNNTVAGKHIVLIDDVLTTGATLETAAKMLKASGAKRVDAIVFAQA